MYQSYPTGADVGSNRLTHTHVSITETFKIKYQFQHLAKMNYILVNLQFGNYCVSVIWIRVSRNKSRIFHLTSRRIQYKVKWSMKSMMWGTKRNSETDTTHLWLFHTANVSIKWMKRENQTMMLIFKWAFFKSHKSFVKMATMEKKRKNKSAMLFN